ncbi:hypothetical protein [Paraburkholderia sediminicola]|uniref:hypothetical protein n=1 Tax=Paraburkholderia sediminicola TaxID=458836 RepID=UPI0038BE0AC0
MLTRQQRRADQRAQAKVKMINATPLALGMLTVFDPALWHPAPAEPAQPEPVQSIAISCKTQAQPDHLSKAGGAVAGAEGESIAETTTKICKTCKAEQPLTAFNSRGQGRTNSNCKQCGKEMRKTYLIPVQHKPSPPVPENMRLPDIRTLGEDWQEQLFEAARNQVAEGARLRAAGVVTKTPERQHTPSGWPIDIFARSAQAIRTERFLKAREAKIRQQSRSNHRTRDEAIEVAA